MKKILKAIYRSVPFKKQFFTLLKKMGTPKESVYQHLHFMGPFTVKIDEKRSFSIIHFESVVENMIFWEGLTGNWEKESLKLWIKLCEQAGSIIDIGANTGVYSLVAKTINPKANVYAFEPHPMFFEMLGKNIQFNQYNIVSYKTAVSDYDGVIQIGDYTGGTAPIETSSIQLDTFVEQNNLKKIDLIKIDVETHEPQVMRGFQKYISRFRPTLLIEILNEDVAQAVNNVVGGLGYLYFNIDERGSIRQTTKIGTSDYYNYLCCSPDIAAYLGLDFKEKK